MYKYFNSSDLNSNETEKNVIRAIVKGTRSLMSFVWISPLPAGSIFRTVQQVMNMKKVETIVLSDDVKIYLMPGILSFLCKMTNRIII